MKLTVITLFLLLLSISLSAQRKQYVELNCVEENGKKGDTITCSVSTILNPKSISLSPEGVSMGMKVISNEYSLVAKNDTILEKKWIIHFQFVKASEYPLDSIRAIIEGASIHNIKDGPVQVSSDWKKYSTAEKEEFIDFVDKTIKNEGTYRIDMNNTDGFVSIEGRGSVRALNKREQRRLRKLIKTITK